MEAALGDDKAPSYPTITKWLRHFRTGHKSTQDAPRPGRPIEVTTEEMVTKVHDRSESSDQL